MGTRASASDRRTQQSPPRPIVVGVDAGGRSTSAVVWAADEADRAGHPLQLVTAHRDESGTTGTMPASATGLAGLARRLTLTDLDYQSVVGSPLDVLLHATKDAALLVVGRRGMGAAQRLMMGSTSMAVAARAPVPVVVVPEQWIQPNMSSAPIVVGLSCPDGTAVDPDAPERDEHVLAFAFARAAGLRVPLIVVSSWEIPNVYAWSPADVAASRHRFEEALDRRLAPWQERFPDVEVVPRSVAEPAGQAVLEASRVAQLAVLGRHPGAHLGNAPLGGTVRKVLHHATHPVAVVPELPDDGGAAAPATERDELWAPTF